MTINLSCITGMTEVEALDLMSYIHFEDLRRSDDPFPYWTSKNTVSSDYPKGIINNKITKPKDII